MKVHRFCSRKEYEKYLSGEKLHNFKDHGKERGYDCSTAVGFCFFVEEPDKAIHWLSGIVDLDYCVTFEVPHTALKLCHGRYVDWKEPGVNNGLIKRTEFCCTEYSKEDFKQVEVSTRFRGYAPNGSEIKEFIKHIRNSTQIIEL